MYEVILDDHTHPGGAAHTIQNEGIDLTARSRLNFVGAAVDVTDDSGNDATKVTITASGSSHTMQDEGVDLTARIKLNFVGALVAVTDDSGNDASKVTISAPGASAVVPDTTNFNDVLSGSDTTVQAALDTLDNHTHGGSRPHDPG